MKTATTVCSASLILLVARLAWAQGAVVWTPPYSYQIVDAVGNVIASESIPADDLIVRSLPLWKQMICPVTCDADIDGDGIVGVEDYRILSTAWGKTCAELTPPE